MGSLLVVEELGLVADVEFGAAVGDHFDRIEGVVAI